MSPSAKLFLSMSTTAALLSLAIATHFNGSEATAAVLVPAPAALNPVQAVSSGGIRVSGALDRTAIFASGDRRVRMELVVSSEASPTTATRAPTDLVIVLDRSGSMSGNKLLDAKSAARELVSLLGEEDRFSLVTYANGAGVEIDLSFPTEANRTGWNNTIDTIQAGGGTHMQAGLATALGTWEKTPGRVMRTILISDGLPDRPDGLMDLAQRSATEEIPLTTIGIGLDYDEKLMTELADAGTGNFYWTQRGDDLAAVFATEFDAARDTVASQVAVTFHSQDGTALTETAGYPIHDSAFDIGSLVAGQTRRIWVTLDLPNSYTGGEEPGRFDLAWYDVNGGRQVATVTVPAVEVANDLAGWQGSFDRQNWERAVLNEEYNVMQTALSQEVQAGDCAGALDVIAGYRERNFAMNDSVGSIAVGDNIAGLDLLEAEVLQQFEGDDQRSKQNVWAKTRNKSAYNGRRNLK